MDDYQQLEGRNNQNMETSNENLAEKDKNENSNDDECRTNPCSVDNSKTVINKIANLYAERLMSDVCLVVGNVSKQLIQNILSSYRELENY